MLETVRTTAVQIRWTTKDCNTIVSAVVNDGELSEFSAFPRSLLPEDFDGFSEFIQAIKQAMADTKPNREW